MNKIKYPVLLLFILFSCVEELHSPQKKDKAPTKYSAQASNCIYWYAVSSEQSENGTNTSQKFVYSSCDNYNSPTPNEQDQESNEDPRNLIPAGGPSFPTSPEVNDEYEYTSPQGDYVRYTFTSDRGWRPVERIIPVSVIEKYPDMFQFLIVKSLMDGMVVFGLDDLYYTYHGGLDEWHGEVKKI